MDRILIVEDDRDHQRLLRDLLGDMGEVEIVAVSNTSEAEKILESEVIDLIILDHWMSDNTGGDWYLHYLHGHKEERIRKLPVLFVTILAMNPEIKRLAREKNVIVIPKPVEFRDLIFSAKKLLQR